MDSLYSLIHPSWNEIISELKPEIDRTFSLISETDFIPATNRIFAPLAIARESIRVVIVGQDPYPNPDFADGFAFSVQPDVRPFPASLTNIFKELESDLSIPLPDNGNLERWSEQGVMLINRTLTTKPGESHTHQRAGWLAITEAIIQSAAQSGAIGILWGGNAHQMEDLFDFGSVIKSVHPSPLSAYKGFFGSKPFSRANDLLIERGLTPIIW
jgi:uracil-DNA glycosylase